MIKSGFVYNIKTATICGMLIGWSAIAYSKNPIWDKIYSTPMSEKIAIAQKNYNKTHFRNMVYTKSVSEKYIQQIINDPELEKFMCNCILTNGVDYYDDLSSILNRNTPVMISTIKSKYIWFDDLMRYLSGKINDEEFYNTGFFDKINQPGAPFSATLYDMWRWRGFIERNNKSR